MSAPVDFGSSRLIQPITAFMAQWPAVEVRLEFSDRMVDLVDEGFDLGVRIGQLTDSSLIARRLAPAPLKVLASPAYLTPRARPSTPMTWPGMTASSIATSPPQTSGGSSVRRTPSR